MKLFLFLTILSFGCQSPNASDEILASYLNKDSARSDSKNYISDCSAILDSLLITSSLENSFGKEIHGLINESNDSVVIIRLVSKQEQNVPAGWVRINLKLGLLEDYSYDEESPIKLVYDNKLMSQFMKNCL